MLVLIALVAPVTAATLSSEALELDGPVHAAAVLEGGDGVRVAVAVEDRVLLLAPSTGEPEVELLVAVEALASADLDGDGADELVLCGEDGLQVLVDDSLHRLDELPCSATAARPRAVATADATGASTWTHEDTGWADPETTTLDLSPAPILAAGPTTFAVGAAGGPTWQELGGETWHLDDGLVAAAWASFEWWVALSGDATLRSVEGGTRTLVHPLAALATADIDGDARLDLVAVDAETGGLVFLADALTSASWASGARGGAALATGDLDGDGCDDAVTADAAGDAWLVRVTDCATLGDDDGDGWRTADGDCDDDDPDVHPEAYEACDGVDQDCDDQVDESERIELVGAPEELAEGGSFALTARLEGCALPWGWGWAIDDIRGLDEEPISACTFEGTALACELLDDGLLMVEVSALDADDRVMASLSQSWKVANLAPELSPTGDLSAGLLDGHIDLERGDSGSEQLLASDPGVDDRVSFALQGAPSWVSLSEEGLLAIGTTTEREGTFAVVLRDDEGATTTYIAQVEVHYAGWYDDEYGTETPWEDEDEDELDWQGLDLGCDRPDPGCDCGGGCCSGSAGFLFLPLWLLRRRRA